MKNILTLSLLICILSFTANATTKFTSTNLLNKGEYFEDKIIIKVKDEFRWSCNKESITQQDFANLLSKFNGVSLVKIFPAHQKPMVSKNDIGQDYADLSLIYEVTFPSAINIEKVINAFLSTNILIYAEPKYIPTIQFTPNDPQIGNQSFLGKIQAYDAWDINQGDTNVVIGITDTGSDMNHPDLIQKIKRNYADPINGTDDDSDGFIDNFNGWDVGENDNNPQVGSCGTCSHGSHVAGCAAAHTDNNDGVASPGFKCMYLPVKIANASGALTAAYEGIVYAADHGCQIINCSWGGQGGGNFGQDVATYATINKNSLVVAAAGNNSSNLSFYPAAYDYVFSVAATNINDTKANFSNYGYYLDISAPGNNIYSTYFDDSYSAQSGTSMASPIVAGCAGIVKSAFPAYNAQQIGEQLRVTADNIYNIPSNSPLIDQLGKGRVNLLNAITLNGTSVRVNNLTFNDNNDNVFIVNDTIDIVGDITNFLDPTTNLVLTLTTTSSFVTIVDGTTTIGAMSTLATATNASDPFKIKVNTNAPQNARITFKLLIQDGSYNDSQTFYLTVNVDYLNITINSVLTTNTSKGRLCYNEINQAQGLGFSYPGDTSLTFEAGLMIGVPGNVSDAVRAANGSYDSDFNSVVAIQKNDPGIWSEFDTYGKFNDNAGLPAIGVTVDYRSFTWQNIPNDKYHIFEYTIKNNSGTAINSLYAGLFSDWDIMNYSNNKAAEDATTKMGYVYSTDASGLYAGIKLLSNSSFKHYAIDNVTGGGGGVDISGGYTSALKYQTLSTNRASAGGAGTGNDVIDVVSTGPFNIANGDSVRVAFAMIAGDELSSIINSANAAQTQYNLATTINENQSSNFIAGEAFPNPTNTQVFIPFYSKDFGNVQISIVDLLGRVVKTDSKITIGADNFEVDLSSLNAGIYQCIIYNQDQKFVSKIIKQ